MRHFESSRPLDISVGLSILLHLALSLYFYYNRPDLFKAESPSMLVDYLPARGGAAEPAAPYVKKPAGQTGRPERTVVRNIPVPRPVEEPPAGHSPETTAEPKPVEVPKPSIEAEGPVPDVANNGPVSEPGPPEETGGGNGGADGEGGSAGTESTAGSPGIKELIPSLDRMSKIDKGKGGTGKDGEILFLDSDDVKYASYSHALTSKIEGIMKYPEAAWKAGLQGRGLVGFTILEDGTISDLVIIESTGYPIFDEQMLYSIRKASPFNPLMENMKAKKVRVIAIFEYSIVGRPQIWKR